MDLSALSNEGFRVAVEGYGKEVETWKQRDGVEGGGVNHVQGRGQGLDVGDQLVMEDLS